LVAVAPPKMAVEQDGFLPVQLQGFGGGNVSFHLRR
jgi:hypothetical protein